MSLYLTEMNPCCFVWVTHRACFCRGFACEDRALTRISHQDAPRPRSKRGKPCACPASARGRGSRTLSLQQRKARKGAPFEQEEEKFLCLLRAGSFLARWAACQNQPCVPTTQGRGGAQDTTRAPISGEKCGLTTHPVRASAAPTKKPVSRPISEKPQGAGAPRPPVYPHKAAKRHRKPVGRQGVRLEVRRTAERAILSQLRLDFFAFSVSCWP